MKQAESFLIQNKKAKPIDLDLRQAENSNGNLVVFCHGFKCLKDWGAFDLVSEKFAEAGIDFLKFNFSMNGTTLEQPTEFADLEAFAQNSFSQELEDLQCVMDWVQSAACPIQDPKVHLIGHSRGGGLAVLYASYQPLSSLITWAAVSDFGKKWSEEFLARAKENNGIVIKNGRTGQDMPMYFSFYQDYLDHFQELSIPLRALQVKCPSLIIHGRKDEAVPYGDALDLNKWITGSSLLLLNGANHTFGAKHPWEEAELPSDLAEVVKASIAFIHST